MIPTIIKGKKCNTIEDFYTLSIPKIKYSCSNKPIHTVEDFFEEFLRLRFEQKLTRFAQKLQNCRF